MNPALLLRIALSIFPYRKELTYVALTFLFVLMLPVIGVLVLANTGIQAVSDVLVRADVSANTVELLYPNGSTYKTLQLNTQWPVKGVITTQFGGITPYQLFHAGIDIANPEGRIGDMIVPVLPGKVTHVGNMSWGYGKHVIIDHGDNISSTYGHLDTVRVNEGDDVTYETVLGTEGETGWATGPHLHFEVRVWGIPVNPVNFLSNL